MAGPFGERGVVGEIVAAGRRGAAMRVEQRGEGEGLRGLHRAQAALRSSVSITQPAASTVLTVSVTAMTGTAAPRFAPPRSRARSAPPTANGRAASWTSTRSGGVRRQRLEAGAHRGLPRRAAEHRRQQRRGRRSQPRNRSLVVADGSPAAPCRSPGAQANASEARPDHRLAGDRADIAWAIRRRRAARGRPRPRRLRLSPS